MKKSSMFLTLILCVSLLFAQNAKKEAGVVPKKEKAAEIKETEPTPSPESIAKGKDVLKKTLEASGGKAVLDIKDIVQVNSMTLTTAQGEMQIEATTTIALPNRVMQTMTTQFGDVKTVFDGTKGWVVGPNGVQELPEAQTNEVKNQVAGNTYTLLQHYDQPEYLIQYLSEEKSGDANFHVIAVKYKPSDFAITLYINTQSNLISKRRSYRNRGTGKAEVEDSYSDYRTVSGAQIPFKIVSFSEGNKIADITMNSVKINSGIKDDAFKKPTE